MSSETSRTETEEISGGIGVAIAPAADADPTHSEPCAQPSLVCLSAPAAGSDSDSVFSSLTLASSSSTLTSSTITLIPSDPIVCDVSTDSETPAASDRFATSPNIQSESSLTCTRNAQDTLREGLELGTEPIPSKKSETSRAPKRLCFETGAGPMGEKLHQFDLQTNTTNFPAGEHSGMNFVANLSSDLQSVELSDDSLIFHRILEPPRLAILAATSVAAPDSLTFTQTALNGHVTRVTRRETENGSLLRPNITECKLVFKRRSFSSSDLRGTELDKCRARNADKRRVASQDTRTSESKGLELPLPSRRVSASTLDLSSDSQSSIISPVTSNSSHIHNPAISASNERLHSNEALFSSRNPGLLLEEDKLEKQTCAERSVEKKVEDDYGFSNSSRYKWVPSPDAAPFVPREQKEESPSIEDVEFLVNSEFRSSSGAPPPRAPLLLSIIAGTQTQLRLRCGPQRRLDTGKHYCGNAAKKTCRVPLAAPSRGPIDPNIAGRIGGGFSGINCVDCMRRDVEVRGLKTHTGYLVNSCGVPSLWDRTRGRFACNRPVDSSGGERRCGAQDRPKRFSGPMSLELYRNETARPLLPLPLRVYCNACSELTSVVDLYLSIM